MNAKSKYVKVCKKGPNEMDAFLKEFSDKLELETFISDPLADPTINYSKLEEIITTSKQNSFPETVVKFNKYKHRLQPWITFDILNQIRSRDNLYIRLKNTNPDSVKFTQLEDQLKSHIITLKKAIRDAKQKYYHKQFENFKTNIKQTWNKINEILSRNKRDSELPSYFCEGNNVITSNQDIANCFNNFFSKIGPALAQTIKGPPGKSYKDYLKKTIHSTFTFSTVNSDDVIKYIKELKSKSSSGHDGISSIMLKHIARKIAPTLSIIINQSLLTGIFPDTLKIAKISPVYKKEDPHLTDNYRPISLLPIISKVFEKVVFKQVYDYFTKNKLLYKSQYGFRKKHSTELAGLELNDIIIENLDQQKLPIAIFLDLSKAFDTIDHEILLDKLKYYGISGSALLWFHSYLGNRRQYVQYKDAFSSYADLKTGVPQGSILGPLLFIIYMNDIAEITKKFHFTIYADDTTLISPLCTFSLPSNSDYNEIASGINSELKLITDWLSLNKLSLNAKKTKMMLFHLPQRSIKNINLKLYINNTRIEQVKEFNFLGVMFDQCMTWKSHTQKIASKISMVVGTISKLKRFLPQDILKTIYNALIQPHLNYGILLWGTLTARILKLQKWAVRAITSSKYNAHSDPLFKKLKLMKVNDIYKLSMLKLYHKYCNNELPMYFENMFEEEYLTHDYPTRHKNDPLLPKSNKKQSENSIRYCLLPTLDNLDTSITDMISKTKFQPFVRHVKKYFIDSYVEVCNRTKCFVCQRGQTKS